ncbi:MAG: hypothetical protein IJG68_02720 [Bacilli bacterium]|nr:hypothetical protein [Bacilli bacterium]
MSDFDVDSLQEYDIKKRSKNKKNHNYKFTFFLVFVFFILLLFVIIMALPIINKKPQEKMTSIDINRMDVQNLYSYVTYGTRNVRYDKFIYNLKVDINSFTDTEKLYYAFRTITKEDFIDTKQVDSFSNRIYFLPIDTVLSHMKLFFGPNVQFSNFIPFNYVFPFQIRHCNVANLEYNPQNEGYDATFTQFLGDESKENPQYLTQLDSAYEMENGELVLYEKVVYLDLIPKGNNYDVLYYKDFNYTTLLGQDYNISLEQIMVDWRQIEGCSTIKYHFALNNSSYYFVSSEIIDENNP